MNYFLVEVSPNLVCSDLQLHFIMVAIVSAILIISSLTVQLMKCKFNLSVSCNPHCSLLTIWYILMFSFVLKTSFLTF